MLEGKVSDMIVSRDKVPYTLPFEGLERRVLATNELIMLVEHVMEEGSVFPMHSHPHEQIGYLLEGKLRVICGGQEFYLEAGDSFAVAGGVEHQVFALERSIALDFITPAREDYAQEVEALREKSENHKGA